MKNSKIIIAVLCIAVTFVYACTIDEDAKTTPPETAAVVTEVIGVQENGEFHINDQDALKATWEKTLLEQGYDVTLERFDFVPGDVIGDGASNMILMASNAEGTVKIATAITLGDEVNNKRPVISNRGTVTCSGCSAGCSPTEHAEYGWICSPCVTSGGCTKTETIETESLQEN